MRLPSLSREKSLSFIGVAFLFVSMVAILFYYRRGGIVDSTGSLSGTPGYRDIGIFVNAAQNLLSGLSPYSLSDLSYRSGSFGVLIFGILDSNPISFVIYQILNMLGFAFFAKVLLRNFISQEVFIACLVVGIWFSCVREVFSTGQITGILAGLAGLGYICVNSSFFPSRLLGALYFAIALDLKPNLFITFVLACYAFHNRIHEVFMPFLILLGGHIVMNIYTGSLLEREWFETLKKVSDPGRDPTSTGTRTIWPIVRRLFNLEVLPHWLPTTIFIFLSIMCLIFVLRSRSQLLLFLTLIIPAFYSYFHLYSFFPFAILMVASCIRFNMPSSLGVTISVLLASGSSFGFAQYVFCIIIGTVFATFLFFTSDFGNLTAFLKRYILSLLATLTIRLVYNFFFDPTYFQEILLLNFVLLLGIVVIILAHFRNADPQKSDSLYRIRP